MSAIETNRQALDSLDHELIGLLRADGRAPLSKLAQILKVSRGTVQNRLDRLVASGTILGFTIRAGNDYPDSAVRALMMIEIAGKSTAQVIRKLRGLPELQMLHTTNGTWDLIAEIHTISLPEFDRVLREVRMIDGVLNSETSLLLSSV
ncbi:Lrp/AsnC family transcriptional regulator [Zoogloeaceae bacterium G21618-S1]|nr:Lrp/AsnC family transcriptional regulator [Zoogloeaceae bacterium G21618-S1]